jgi:hypothetical protein
MKEYVGLDVSLEVTHFCILDEAGAVVGRGRASREEPRIAAFSPIDRVGYAEYGRFRRFCRQDYRLIVGRRRRAAG